MSKTFKIIICIALIIAMGASIMYSKNASDVESHQSRIEYLEGKESSSKALIAASAATSVVMTLLPQDVGTPLADKFADICGYFTIALCAILLEKYLLTLTGLVAFRYLIPAACVFLIIGIIRNRDRVKSIGIKILLFAIAIYMLVPCSIKASQLIENTYKIASIEAAEASENVSEISSDNPAGENDEAASDVSENKNFIQRIADSVKSFGSKVGEAVKELPDTVTKDVNKYLEEGEKKLSLIIEALAILIVTSCLIPILVIILLVYLIKMISGIEIDSSIIVKGSNAAGALGKKKE